MVGLVVAWEEEMKRMKLIIMVSVENEKKEQLILCMVSELALVYNACFPCYYFPCFGLGFNFDTLANHQL